MSIENRNDPFEEDNFVHEVAQFKKKKPGRKKSRPPAEEVKKVAEVRGFNDRNPVSPPEKEPLRSMQFFMRESERDAFRQRAFQEFGPGQGALIALFRKMWERYCDSNP
jgi:hypothetical protein